MENIKRAKNMDFGKLRIVEEVIAAIFRQLNLFSKAHHGFVSGIAPERGGMAAQEEKWNVNPRY